MTAAVAKPKAALSTLYVVDDDPAVREALQAAGRFLKMRVETYESAEQFLERHQPADGGCLLLDVKMPGMTGLELQAVLAEQGVCLPVIMMSGQADVPSAVSAMHQGAITFIEKPFGLEQIRDQIAETLATGMHWRKQWRLRRDARERLSRLTDPQREVLELLAAGHSNQKMAERLGISLRAVEDRKSRLIQALKATSLAELLAISMLGKESSKRGEPRLE